MVSRRSIFSKAMDWRLVAPSNGKSRVPVQKKEGKKKEKQCYRVLLTGYDCPKP
jgi:hypothetical protein